LDVFFWARGKKKEHARVGRGKGEEKPLTSVEGETEAAVLKGREKEKRIPIFVEKGRRGGSVPMFLDQEKWVSRVAGILMGMARGKSH